MGKEAVQLYWHGIWQGLSADPVHHGRGVGNSIVHVKPLGKVFSQKEAKLKFNQKLRSLQQTCHEERSLTFVDYHMGGKTEVLWNEKRGGHTDAHAKVYFLVSLF